MTRCQCREVPHSLHRLRSAVVSARQLSHVQVVRFLVLVLMAVSPSVGLCDRR